PARRVLEGRAVELVAGLAAHALGANEPRTPKRREVLGDSLTADGQLGGQRAGRDRRAASQGLDNPAPGWVRERGEDRVDRRQGQTRAREIARSSASRRVSHAAPDSSTGVVAVTRSVTTSRV